MIAISDNTNNNIFFGNNTNDSIIIGNNSAESATGNIIYENNTITFSCLNEFDNEIKIEYNKNRYFMIKNEKKKVPELIKDYSFLRDFFIMNTLDKYFIKDLSKLIYSFI